MCIEVLLFGFVIYGTSYLLDLDDYFRPHIR